MEKIFESSVELIKNSNRITAFTGAGISVESGIPAFRGENGLWSKYDPTYIDINYFLNNPESSWKVIKEIFFDTFCEAKPNYAHNSLTILQKNSLLNSIITQNIDNLHQEAGSVEVCELHGNSKSLVCIECGYNFTVSEISLNSLPPLCSSCRGILKPDFVFFGESLPEQAIKKAEIESRNSDLFILIGTTGEVMPACMFPYIAKKIGAKVIEINTNFSNFTNDITDIFLKGKATEVMIKLIKALKI